jgi:2-haloacid dehalogenase
VAVAEDRWLTFDCYGTLADWNACLLAALTAVAGSQGPALLAAYHQAELIAEAGQPWLPYRSVLSQALIAAARRVGVRLPAGAESALADAWPQMPVFPDTAAALSALAAAGWRMAILTNCDEDLFATTRPRLPVPFDLVVTAEQVRSYKPDLAHFRQFAALTGATPRTWIHDILPAALLGVRCVWVDRDLTGHPAKMAERRITALRRLPEMVADVTTIPAWP